jgi:hypothetical protein
MPSTTRSVPNRTVSGPLALGSTGCWAVVKFSFGLFIRAVHRAVHSGCSFGLFIGLFIGMGSAGSLPLENAFTEYRSLERYADTRRAAGGRTIALDTSMRQAA